MKVGKAMYQGYNLDLQKDSQIFKDHDKQEKKIYYKKKGEEIYEEQRRIITKDLDDFKNLSGNLDANQLINEWFPEVEADIFLSHSHNNRDVVLSLAGWLYQNFGLISFIDSTVWGYADDLLKNIDDKFCKSNPSYYSYDKRNYSTAHVHMMLASSLIYMIDKCECIFFINTPQSFKPEDEMDQKGKTKSSWIFLEMVTSKIIRKKSRELSLESIDMMESGRSLKYLPIEYPLDLSHLLRIDADDLKKWQTKFQAKNNKIDEDNRLLSLDILYQMHNSNLR